MMNANHGTFSLVPRRNSQLQRRPGSIDHPRYGPVQSEARPWAQLEGSISQGHRHHVVEQEMPPQEYRLLPCNGSDPF